MTEIFRLQQFEYMCRACMRKKETITPSNNNIEKHNTTYRSLFEPLDVKYQHLRIIDLFNLVAPQILIRKDDGFPTFFCSICIEQMQKSYEFQQMCINSDNQMRVMVETHDKTHQNLPIMILSDGYALVTNILTDVKDPLGNENKDYLKTENQESDDKQRLLYNDYHRNSCTNNLKFEINEVSESYGDFDTRICFDYIENESSSNVDMKQKHLLSDTSRKKSIHMKCKNKKNHRKPNEKSFSQKRNKTGDSLKPYLCSYCNKSFQQSCTLKEHIRIHTGEQPYLCSECGKAFKSSSNMKQHLLRHTGILRYECPDCPKKFPCLSDLASHKAVHKKHKPHKCNICGAAFGKPFQLKKHNMYHNGEKPYKCEYCEMRFVCGDHMRRHMRTHTGEKPYKCEYCSRAFAQSNDMIKHLRSHLGEEVYKCELCPKGFRLASELRTHFSMHKNDSEEMRINNLKALREEENKLRIKLSKSSPNAQAIELDTNMKRIPDMHKQI